LAGRKQPQSETRRTIRPPGRTTCSRTGPVDRSPFPGITHDPFGPPTGNDNGIAHSDSSSRIVILNEVKNLLVGVSVVATDAATPGSILRRMILRYAQNDRSRLTPSSGRRMAAPGSPRAVVAGWQPPVLP